MINKKPKCKNCGEHFTPLNNNNLQKYCFKTACVYVWIEVSKAKAWLKKKREYKEKNETVTDWIKKTQKTFNEFIRLRDKDQNCISCNKPLIIGNVDAGHLWSAGGHFNIRFNEMNVHAQCSRPCNKDKSGDTNNYRLGLVTRYGKDVLDDLDSKAHITRHFTKEELKELNEYYTSKIKQLKEK